MTFPRNALEIGCTNVIATAVTKYSRSMLAVPALGKDGTHMSIEFTLTLLEDDFGILHGIETIIRDVTTRRDKENEIRGKLATFEAASVDKCS